MMSEDHVPGMPLSRRACLQILLEACYRDGNLDPSKDGTLVGLARAIGVEGRTARRIARSARRRTAAGELGPPAPFDAQRVYDRAEELALVDGKLQPREIAILERLRKVIRLAPLHPDLAADSEDTPPRGIAIRGPAPRLGRPKGAKPGAALAGGAPPRPRGAEHTFSLQDPRAAASASLDPLARVPPLAEAGRHDELAEILMASITSQPPSMALETSCRHAIAEALKRVESRPELTSALKLLAAVRALADRVPGAAWLWGTYARAAARLARELARRGAWDEHADVARGLYEVTGEFAEEVAPHRARLLRDAMLRRFETRQQEEGWALFYGLRALHAAAPQREGVAREMGIALGRAFLCVDVGEQLGGPELAAAAQSLLALARAYPRDLALTRRALAAGPQLVPVLASRGPSDALPRYLADLSDTARHWPGHETVLAGVARACEKLVVHCQLERPDDIHTPAQAIQLLRELRRIAPSSAGVADAMVMVAAQTGASLDPVPSAAPGAIPLDWLDEEVRPLWRLGEELAALPDDAAIRARISLRVPDDEPRLARAAAGEPLSRPEDLTYVADLLHEIERQLDRCPGNYWPSRADWFRAMTTAIGECAHPRLARLASAICDRLCWPEPF